MNLYHRRHYCLLEDEMAQRLQIGEPRLDKMEGRRLESPLENLHSRILQIRWSRRYYRLAANDGGHDIELDNYFRDQFENKTQKIDSQTQKRTHEIFRATVAP